VVKTKDKTAKGRIKINPELCKGCMLCTRACPKGIIRRGDVFNCKGYYVMVCNGCERCTGCAMCAQVCPDAAIEVWK